MEADAIPDSPLICLGHSSGGMLSQTLGNVYPNLMPEACFYGRDK